MLFVDAYGNYRSLGGELNLTNGNYGNYAYTLTISKLKINKEVGLVTFTANSTNKYSFNLLTGELKAL